MSEHTPTQAEPTPYERLGGAEGVRRLVDHFYAHMDTLPEARTIRAMHARDLSGARDKLFDFLSGWLGGPPLYWQKHGHPRLRARHLPFPIDVEAAAAWMRCMHLALVEVVEDPALRDGLATSFAQVANHMRNQPE